MANITAAMVKELREMTGAGSRNQESDRKHRASENVDNLIVHLILYLGEIPCQYSQQRQRKQIATDACVELQTYCKALQQQSIDCDLMLRRHHIHDYQQKSEYSEKDHAGQVSKKNICRSHELSLYFVCFSALSDAGYFLIAITKSALQPFSQSVRSSSSVPRMYRSLLYDLFPCKRFYPPSLWSIVCGL